MDLRGFLDYSARALARLLLAVFYRNVEVSGLERVPARGPVLFVANHGNALVDAMVLVAVLPRLPRFLAKHTLWQNPAVRPLLALAGAIPIYRAQEGDTSRNEQAFARCFAELAAGGAVALFPEGISHDQPALQPLRTGAARIALGARASGARPVAIVPVGLTFEDKRRFRSRMLLCVGEPIEASESTGDAASPKGAQRGKSSGAQRGEAERRSEEIAERSREGDTVRALTEQIDAGLRAVTLNFDSWQTARLAQRAAEIYGGDAARPMPGRSALANRFSLSQAFGLGYEEARAVDPDRVAALEAMARRYELLLEAFSLRDDHVTADYPWSHVAGYVGYRVPELLARLPFAIVGLLLNYVPYRLPGWVATFVEHEGDQPATYKLLTGFFLFPIVWTLEIAAAGWAWGTGGALAIAVAAPATGWIALRFYERNESFWRELRAWLTLRMVKHRAAELRVLRRMMREELHALVDANAG